MSPDEAADLAARTLAAIDVRDRQPWQDVFVADRERVASDLGLFQGADHLAAHSEFARAVRDTAEANLRRTAALYGVQP